MNPGSVLILGQVTQFGHQYLTCIAKHLVDIVGQVPLYATTTSNLPFTVFERVMLLIKHTTLHFNEIVVVFQRR